MRALIDRVRVMRTSNAAAAGKTDVADGTAVDSSNYEGTLFVAAVGTVVDGGATAVQVVASDESDMSDAEEVAAVAVPDGGSDKLVTIDVRYAQRRYLRCVVKRKTANATLDGVVALQYGPRREPAPRHSTVLASVRAADH